MRHNINKWFRKTGIAMLIVGLAVSLKPNRAFAAEEIIFTYGGVTESVSLEELRNFAEKGEISPSLNFLLNSSQQNPLVMRSILKQEFPANTKLIYELFNTAPGEYLLSQTSNVVGSKSERADVAALRGALIASASNDNEVSLIELLENYPAQQVYINGKTLIKVRRNLGEFIQETDRYVETLLSILKS